jgi:hypothetical protein
VSTPYYCDRSQIPEGLRMGAMWYHSAGPHFRPILTRSQYDEVLAYVEWCRRMGYVEAVP